MILTRPCGTRADWGESDNVQGEAIRPSCGGSRFAAPRSSRYRVRCLPRAPAAGPEKAGAVRLGLSDGGPVQVPAAGARGRQRTLFRLDRGAAGRLPPQLGLGASS